MCLIIHKPAGCKIPHALLRAAVRFNADGWGLMGLRSDGSLLLERHAQTDLDALLKTERTHRRHDYCLHLRLRTRGASTPENAHPLKVSDRLYLMHNGTLKLNARVPGRSDSWHLATDLLRPLAATWPDLFSDPAFGHLLELGMQPENKLALLDTERRAFILINRQYGAELEGLWLSSTRWIDRRLFPLAGAPQPQERSYDPAALKFAG